MYKVQLWFYEYSLLAHAVRLVSTGFEAPVPPHMNLGWGGQILLRLCERNATMCPLLTSQRILCRHSMVWSEFQVYEVDGWREGGECVGLDHEHLRKLRTEYELPAIKETWGWR